MLKHSSLLREQKNALIRKAFIGLALAVGLWFAWKPLGATIAVMLVGDLQKFFRLYGLRFSQKTAVVVGNLVGGLVAVGVFLLSLYAMSSWIGMAWLSVLAFFAVGYISYTPNPRFVDQFDQFDLLDRNRKLVGASATVAYVLTLAVVLGLYWYHLHH